MINKLLKELEAPIVPLSKRFKKLTGLEFVDYLRTGGSISTACDIVDGRANVLRVGKVLVVEVYKEGGKKNGKTR